MAALFLMNGRVPAIAPGVRLVKAEEAGAFLSALELSSKTKAMEEDLRQKAEEAFEARKNQGYQEGVEAGRDEYTLKIMDTVMASVEYLEKLEGDLANIVEEAVRKIIGDMPSEKVVVGLVRKALTLMRDDRRVVVRVAPGDEEAVRKELQGASGEAAASFLDVRADGRLSKGDCILESELGVVEASLETQLRNLSQALKSRVKGGG